MRPFAFIVLIGATASGSSHDARTSPMLGDWREPTGAIIRIEQCSSGVCLRILFLDSHAPAIADVHNPGASLRSRCLRNLEIGSRFQLSDATHAFGGFPYDPESGNTYRGTMVVEGDILRLRGYIEVPIFGRTETLQSASGDIAPCRGMAKQ